MKSSNTQNDEAGQQREGTTRIERRLYSIE